VNHKPGHLTGTRLGHSPPNSHRFAPRTDFPSPERAVGGLDTFDDRPRSYGRSIWPGTGRDIQFARPRADAFATGLVGRQDAEDVFSQAMTKALGAPKFPTVDNPRAYLYRAVFNEANTWRRRLTMRRSAEAKTYVDKAVETPIPRPEVMAAVLSLSTRQRAAVILTYWIDLDIAGVAERLGSSEGAVRRHLARARARLRRILDDRSD